LKEYEAKQNDTEEKRRMYEQEMEKQKDENAKRALLKQTQIEKVLVQNVQKEEDKRQAYFNSQKETEKRKTELEEKSKQEMIQKRQESILKDQKRIQVLSYFSH